MASFTTTELRQRGWTSTAISRFLGRPDRITEKKTRSGWTYSANHFAAARVLAAEQTKEFQAWTARRDVRRRAAEEGLQRAVAEAAAWTPALVRLELGALRQAAVDHYNARLARRSRWGESEDERPRRPATVGDDHDFIDRISVNYLRHVGTRYDDVLERLRKLGRRGDEAIRLVRCLVLERIRDVYPELAAECERQLQKRRT